MAFPSRYNNMNGTLGYRRQRPRSVSPLLATATTWSISTWTKAAALLCFVYILISGYSFLRLDSLSDKHSNIVVNQKEYSEPIKREPATTKPKDERVQENVKNHNAFRFDRDQAEAALKKYGSDAIRKVITAYIEPPLNDTIPGTGSRGNLDDDKDTGAKPTFKVPLPLRTQTPDDLQKYEYRQVKTCRDMPGKFPIDRGLEIDSNGDVVVWNVGDTPTPDDFPQQEAHYCPVEADSFLPWIHDVFPSQDGKRVHVIAQNKRKCRTGKKFTKDVNRLVPQVALLQSVSVQRINESEARTLAPELWQSKGNESDQSPRYRLAPYEEADPDGMFTRFICRFHMTDFTSGVPRTVVLGETLSEFPFNYEMVSYRKGRDALLTPKGKDSRLFWTSNIRFYCPVPSSNDLQRQIAIGNVVLSDGTAAVHLDLVPIRTSVRYDEIYLTEDMIGPKESWQLKPFDASKRWGNTNVLPRVEASGRWENIPICFPPQLVDNHGGPKLLPSAIEKATRPEKPHFLSACLWASAEFKTRGLKKGATTDTQDRLQEWIEFHLMVGFDHIYVYDNSGAHTNETSLEPVLARYPGVTTRIDWPSIVCNNNIPAHDSTGERSSQYAAENSCRTRYAPFTEWIAAFDTDEYLVPMGKYTNMKDVLRDAGKQGTNILSFRSSRGHLRFHTSMQVGSGREKLPNTTFLEAYNCDSGGIPKPAWAERARKQLYRADYVLYHFVHYSTVTQGYLTTFKELGGKWRQHFGERSPSERVTDEMNEAVMIHTKTLKKDMTSLYKSRCRYDYDKKWQGCYVAYPFPNNTAVKGLGLHDSDGMEYNCFVNEKVDNYWVPRLEDAMRRSKSMLATNLSPN